MDAHGDITLGLGYASPTQQVRRISEAWIASNGYCLKCDSDDLVPTPAHTRSRDFVCENCSHGYELKSKCGVFSTRVLDGAYAAMVRTIREGNTPTFLLLEYSTSWSISGLRAIHHSLITEAAVEARKPLAPSARRAGWIGCNIVLPAIAIEGQIPIVQGGVLQPKSTTRSVFARLESLSLLSYKDRSWAATILNLLHRLPSTDFALTDVYRFDSELQKLFPNNKHIRPKIRQQLQNPPRRWHSCLFGKRKISICRSQTMIEIPARHTRCNIQVAIRARTTEVRFET
jgi:type II restriction enzyme